MFAAIRSSRGSWMPPSDSRPTCPYLQRLARLVPGPASLDTVVQRSQDMWHTPTGNLDILAVRIYRTCTEITTHSPTALTDIHYLLLTGHPKIVTLIITHRTLTVPRGRLGRWQTVGGHSTWTWPDISVSSDFRRSNFISVCLFVRVRSHDLLLLFLSCHFLELQIWLLSQCLQCANAWHH